MEGNFVHSDHENETHHQNEHMLEQMPPRRPISDNIAQVGARTKYRKKRKQSQQSQDSPQH